MGGIGVGLGIVDGVGWSIEYEFGGNGLRAGIGDRVGWTIEETGVGAVWV